MRKTLTAALAALTLGGAISATAVTGAEARPGFHGGYYHHGGGRGGAAIAAGVAGLAIGAALASNHGYYHGYYGPAYYYGPPGPYYYGPYTCYATRWIWDPYVGHRVPVREAYAC